MALRPGKKVSRCQIIPPTAALARGEVINRWSGGSSGVVHT